MIWFFLCLLPCVAFRQNFATTKSTRLYSNSQTLWDVLSSNLKNTARSWFIQRAERSGVDWNAITQSYKNELHQLEDIYSQTNNKSIEYPAYYTRPFHGYDTGNLNWLAALEGEAATLSMAVNYWKGNDPMTTELWLRNNVSQNIQSFIEDQDALDPTSILDIGCSVGISTEYLYKSFPKTKNMAGLDLSPYFISLANYRAQSESLPIQYYHQNAETPSFTEKFDLIVCNFILHEVPKEPTVRILESLKELLSDNGTLAVVDLDPTKVQDNLIVNNFRKWAFEVTEPHIYEYYQSNMVDLLESVGFSNVQKVNNVTQRTT